MKQLKTLLLATALCIGTISFTQAQTKVAHINTQELIQAMPEMKAAQAELETLGKTYQTDMQGSVTEYQNLKNNTKLKLATKTDEENQKRRFRITRKATTYSAISSRCTKRFAEKEIALLQPITEKAKAAILKVCKSSRF